MYKIKYFENVLMDGLNLMMYGFNLFIGCLSIGMKYGIDILSIFRLYDGLYMFGDFFMIFLI